MSLAWRKRHSGVALHVRKEICASEPVYSHPPFDVENRIVALTLADMTVASVYVPNGGKDFPAKMQFLSSLEEWAAHFGKAARRSCFAAT